MPCRKGAQAFAFHPPVMDITVGVIAQTAEIRRKKRGHEAPFNRLAWTHAHARRGFVLQGKSNLIQLVLGRRQK